MAYTQADLDAIETQIASAVEAVRLGDKSVTFRPLSELLQQRDIILASLSSGTTETMSTYASFSKD